jgi:hypothetical protein
MPVLGLRSRVVVSLLWFLCAFVSCGPDKQGQGDTTPVNPADGGTGGGGAAGPAGRVGGTTGTGGAGTGGSAVTGGRGVAPAGRAAR